MVKWMRKLSFLCVPSTNLSSIFTHSLFMSSFNKHKFNNFCSQVLFYWNKEIFTLHVSVTEYLIKIRIHSTVEGIDTDFVMSILNSATAKMGILMMILSRESLFSHIFNRSWRKMCGNDPCEGKLARIKKTKMTSSVFSL